MPRAEIGALPHRRRDIVARRIRDSGVVVDLRTNDIYELNDTAMRVFELLDEATSVDNLGARLAIEFDIDPARAAMKTSELLARFEAQGLVSR